MFGAEAYFKVEAACDYRIFINVYIYCPSFVAYLTQTDANFFSWKCIVQLFVQFI